MPLRLPTSQPRVPVYPAGMMQLLKYAPIRFYRLDDPVGSSTIRDRGLQKKNGTAGTGVMLGVAGILSKDGASCASFAAGTAISIPVDGLPTGGSWSVSTLFLYPSLPGVGQATLWCFGTNAAHELEQIYFSSDNKVHLDTGGASCAGIVCAANVLQHVVVVCDSSAATVYLYQQGSVVGNTGVDTPTPLQSLGFIGIDNGAHVSLAHQQDVAWFNYALTPTQVATLYNSYL